jgi:hypothetical protein
MDLRKQGALYRASSRLIAALLCPVIVLIVACGVAPAPPAEETRRHLESNRRPPSPLRHGYPRNPSSSRPLLRGDPRRRAPLFAFHCLPTS